MLKLLALEILKDLKIKRTTKTPMIKSSLSSLSKSISLPFDVNNRFSNICKIIYRKTGQCKNIFGFRDKIYGEQGLSQPLNGLLQNADT